MNPLSLAWRNVTRQPARALACTLAVAVGASFYLLLTGSVEAFLGQFERMGRLLGAELVVHRSRATSPWSATLTAQEVAQLASVSGVQRIHPVTMGRTEVLGDHFFMAFGLDPAPEVVAGMRELEGQLPLPGSEQVAVGVFAARRLGLAVGGTFDLRGRRLSVAGVYRTGHSLLDHGAILPLGLAQELFNFRDHVSFVLAAAQTGADPTQVAGEISARYSGLEATTTDMWVSMYGHFKLVRDFFRLVAVLCLVVAMVSVSSVMQMALLARGREYAILRAVGWQRGWVGVVILAETAAYAFFGAIVAPLCAEVMLLSVAPLRAEAAGFVAPHVNPDFIPECILATLLISPVGAILPGWRAMRLPPAHTLQLP